MNILGGIWLEKEKEILELAKELSQLKKNDTEAYKLIIELVKKLRQIGS